MKRLWIGIVLLAAILVLGFWTSRKMEDIHSDIRTTLTHAAQAAQDGRWEQADDLARQVRQHWHGNWSFSAALADHTVLDEIDGLFAQAQVYREHRDSVAYAAICARLSAAIDALQEAHHLTWRNLL